MTCEEKLIEYERENTILKGLLAKSAEPCIYCELAQSRMGECKLGFPGCGRMDDIMVYEAQQIEESEGADEV